MNEVLVAGEAVATRRQLDPYNDSFQDWRDRMYWDRVDGESDFLSAMPDAIHELYQRLVYPPMSHPLSDPAVSAVAARLGGLEVPHPRRARILEIGCCSGHNLIPLAQRWPESRFTGIDLAERAIHEARERAAAAGIGNVDFHAVDLREFEPADGPFDFIIAHGFFSWVPDEVKVGFAGFLPHASQPVRHRDGQLQSRMRLETAAAGDRESPRDPTGRGRGCRCPRWRF